ncbi:PREDICTED: protein PYRICULARIA ORYZAE RESISTANCE 21-like [Tarenaya hassleriana]|uniref:protein PYRICULARIA ORYZAE RESISTANCE 21-like n=1 Tax=Tarenaya hassleriana TaxID=28532 RepID=UPI0008FD4DC2|nr:PREDICTED: protein PYRICULARIA ORYZAE RESISTANCE 21-like [Tarenaya hassleriana]
MFLLFPLPPISHSSLIPIDSSISKNSTMATKKVIEVKVDINCEKCKTAVMDAVTELQGVDKVALDVEKSILTVVGTMDPVCVAMRLKKIKQKPVIVTIGPPKPPEPKPQPKPEPNKIECKCKPLPPYCNSCEFVTVNTYDTGSGCTIV